MYTYGMEKEYIFQGYCLETRNCNRSSIECKKFLAKDVSVCYLHAATHPVIRHGAPGRLSMIELGMGCSR